jgi:hypothetical protein
MMGPMTDLPLLVSGNVRYYQLLTIETRSLALYLSNFSINGYMMLCFRGHYVFPLVSSHLHLVIGMVAGSRLGLLCAAF